MPGDQPGETFVKDKLALEKEAQKLKGMAVPLLDEAGNPVGKITNVRTEVRLIGDAEGDLQDKKVSIHYEPVEHAAGGIVTQTDLNISNAYYTDTPRNARQDSMPDTPEPPATDTFEAEAKELLSVLSEGVPDTTLGQLKGKSLREQISMLKFARTLLPKPDAGGAPSTQKAGNGPVLPLPTPKEGNTRNTGMKYAEVFKSESGRTARAYDPRALFGNARAQFTT